jgi:hypothetical protein
MIFGEEKFIPVNNFKCFFNHFRLRTSELNSGLCSVATPPTGFDPKPPLLSVSHRNHTAESCNNAMVSMKCVTTKDYFGNAV